MAQESQQFELTKISELPLSNTIDNLMSLGVNQAGDSVRVPISLLKGNKGDAPTIGANGNWWISGVDTGQTAQSVPNNKVIYNVSQITGLTYATKQEARNVIPANLRGLDQFVIYRLTGIGTVSEQYKGADLTGWAIETNWETLGDKLPKNIVLFNQDETINLSDYRRNNVTLLSTNGTLVAAPSWGAVIYKVKLKANTTYTIEGLNHEATTTVPVLFFYTNGLDGVASSRVVYRSANNIYTFTTDSVELWVSFNEAINRPDLVPPVVYDFSNTAKIIQPAGTYLGNDKIVSADKVIIEFVRGGQTFENVPIPADKIVENAVFDTTWTGSVNRMGLTIYNFATATTKILDKMDLGEDYLYFIDLGVDPQFTTYAFVYDSDANVPSLFHFPICPKNQFFTGKIFKKLSLFIKFKYPHTGADWDATSTIKITRRKCTRAEIITPLGDIFKLNQGAIDLSHMTDIAIAKPRQMAIYKEWGSNKGMTKDVRVTKEFEFQDLSGNYISGLTDTGVQGSSSAELFEQKNTKTKFYNAQGEDINIRFGDNFKTNKFHHKIHANEFLCCRNTVTAILANEVYKKANLNLFDFPFNENEKDMTKRFHTGAKGHIDGFPFAFFDNGAFIGLKSFNTSVDRANLNMKKNNLNHCIFKAATYRALTTTERSAWTEENRGNDAILDTDWTIMSNFLTWVNNASQSGGVFRAEAPLHMNIRAFAAYYILNYYAYGFDNWSNNTILATYDGQIMTPYLYDYDNSWGHGITSTMDPTKDFIANYPLQGSPWPTPSTVTLWNKFKLSFMPEIRAMYQELKALGLLNPAYIKGLFKEFEDAIPFDVYELTGLNWRNIFNNRPASTTAAQSGNFITGGYYTSFKHAYKYIEDRYNFMELMFNN